MSAILFGSISTLVDTSELQRRAFNESFEAHGLDWQWSQPDYVAMLESNGGAQRIADYADARGDDVDAEAVHATKSQIFQELLATAGLEARPGVVATVNEAKRRDVKLGFVTTTSPENISALLEALSPDIDAETFDVIVDSDLRSESQAGCRGISVRPGATRREFRFRRGNRRQRRRGRRRVGRRRDMHCLPEREHRGRRLRVRRGHRRLPRRRATRRPRRVSAAAASITHPLPRQQGHRS